MAASVNRAPVRPVSRHCLARFHVGFAKVRPRAGARADLAARKRLEQTLPRSPNSVVQMDAHTYAGKATPKSLRTRARILNAAMRLFAELGYHEATNPRIAQAASLTRGAMLYHFASRDELVEAAVQHIELARAALFESAAQASAAPGQDASEAAIDAYWALLHETPFVAFAELEAAARTDAMLGARLAAA